ncbi:DUF397 domain-containing protein [Streptomyces sp. NPDC002055]|uniref:DUF397 domain-containing protein n=1 Tax=Streptomyces sp. NPDC002055 TaxID=3154534 RepID=UPI003322DC9F
MSPIPNASTTGYDWFKSSYSSGDNTCVECANVPGVVPVRDSKDPHGPALVFTGEGWSSFIAAVKTGEIPSA